MHWPSQQRKPPSQAGLHAPPPELLPEPLPEPPPELLPELPLLPPLPEPDSAAPSADASPIPETVAPLQPVPIATTPSAANGASHQERMPMSLPPSFGAQRGPGRPPAQTGKYTGEHELTSPVLSRASRPPLLRRRARRRRSLSLGPDRKQEQRSARRARRNRGRDDAGARERQGRSRERRV